MAEDQNTSMSFMGHIRGVMLAGASLIAIKGRTYGPSWKRRGGQGAWFTLVRPWDRLETIVARHGGDVFAAVAAEPLGGDGTALDAIRDCRNYLSLVEAEMVARGVVDEPHQQKTCASESFREDLNALIERYCPGEQLARVTRYEAPEDLTRHYRVEFQVSRNSPHGPSFGDLAQQHIFATGDPADPHHVERTTDAERDRPLGAGEVTADGEHYSILDLGTSADLWSVSLGAVASPWPGTTQRLHEALCCLGEATLGLEAEGALVASRRLLDGSTQILIRIP